MFQFKQFSVDQSGCAMKINTDGVLLGAIAGEGHPFNILDIGTGTGVIALMLAQRFMDANVDAVEIDEAAGKTADLNFKQSVFAERLRLYPLGFEEYFEAHPERKYELIVSNPPFYINSLKSPGDKKTLAKHTDADFFERLITNTAEHLNTTGKLWLIVPVNIADLIVKIAENHKLFPGVFINVKSYPESEAHRVIVCLGFDNIEPKKTEFIIYSAPKIYSDGYREVLQPYFLAF